jgi:UDP-N-acetylmuramoyl-tripeptide--D-alanyl-D-alanine ligase
MIENQAQFSKNEFIEVFANYNFEMTDSVDDNLICNAISTDSRKIQAGNCFVALIGENFDGHSKIEDAFSNGASLAIVSQNYCKDHPELDKYPLIKLDDTLIALGLLAAFHRKRFSYPVIAIAGSNGKTTTKELTALLLSKKYNVLKTFENFNNQVGVPLMLLSMNDSYDIAVLEIGTNQPGEISILSKITAPTHGLITNIGKEHLEQLIDIDGVEMEETALYAYLRKHSAVAFVNCDDERLVRYARLFEKKVVFGNDNQAHLNASFELDENLCPEIKLQSMDASFTVKMQTPGLALAYNAIAASAIALKLEISDNQIKEALESYTQDDSHGYARMKLDKVNSNILLNDTYNANPNSMMFSLLTLSKYKSDTSKIAILGDMREMGEASHEEHLELINFASPLLEKLLLVGNEFSNCENEIGEKFTNIQYFENQENLFSYLEQNRITNSAILVKGSRGMRMEKVVEWLSK